MSINLLLVPETAKTELRALLQKDLTELSAYGEVNLCYPYLEAYWQEPGQRWPYHLSCGDAVIGFAFVRRLGETEFSMAEFYVDHSARGRGHGVQAAVRVIFAHPGWWTLTIRHRNMPARHFWSKVIAAVDAQKVSRGQEHGDIVYRFNVTANS